jgi:phosphopantetheinyl transferase
MHVPLGIARRFFSETELAFVENADDIAAAFFIVWTAKEAIVKASGKGIGASDLRGFTVPFGAVQPQQVMGIWSVATLEPPMRGYHAALALRTGVEPVNQNTVDASSLV